MLQSAISGDGKQLAYYTKSCGQSGCRYAVMIQDVGGTARRAILANATSVHALTWSPDRRSLLFEGTIGGVSGFYVLSVVGGAPRLVNPSDHSWNVAFFAGGDSLLIGSGDQRQVDSIYWIRVAALDGGIRDSIRVAGPRAAFASAIAVPGTRWIATAIWDMANRKVARKIIDRRGNVIDRSVPTCWCEVAASRDALWFLQFAQPSGVERHLVRVPIDTTTGRLGARRDTMPVPRWAELSITTDGASLAMTESASDHSAWAMDFADVLAGRFDELKRIARASVPVDAYVSPDGARVLVIRTLPVPTGGFEQRETVMPFGGGAETPIVTQGSIEGGDWTDSVTASIVSITPAGERIALHDVRTGTEREETYLPDSALLGLDHIAGGWVWVGWSAGEVRTRVAGRTRKYPKPAWFDRIFFSAADPAGQRVAFAGPHGVDTLGIGVLSLDTGTESLWGAFLWKNFGGIRWLDDGSLVAEIFEPRGLTLYRISGPGRVQMLGTIPRPVTGMTFDRKLRRATVTTEDSHGDAWLQRVVRR